jgi:hypothetical protein
LSQDPPPDDVLQTDSADKKNSNRASWTPEWNKEASLDRVLRVFEGFDPRLKALFAKADPASIKVWQLMDMATLHTWVSKKLALLGDAAHPCLPCKPHPLPTSSPIATAHQDTFSKTKHKAAPRQSKTPPPSPPSCRWERNPSKCASDSGCTG